MADTGILKEYLIEVGVRADTGALTKFANIISVIERMTVSLTAAMGAGVLAIEGLVYVATSELEDLYWATKRLKSSASDIQDFQLRMQKAGGSASDARQALETLQQFRRTNPFGDQFLGIMGINAQGKGATQVLDALIVRFKQFQKQGQEYMAFNWGERLGFSYQQITTMLQTGTKAEHAYADAYKKLNINQRQALEDSHRYQNELRDFTATLDVTTKALGLKFLPVAERFMKWLQSPEAEQMGQNLFTLATAVGNLADNGAKLLAGLPPEALEMGMVGFFLFGKKGALILGLIGAAAGLLDKMAGGKAGVQKRQDEQLAKSKQGAWTNFKNAWTVRDKNAPKTTEGTVRSWFGLKPESKTTDSLSSWLGSLNKKGTVAVPFGKKKDLPLGVWGGNQDKAADIAINKTLLKEDAALSGKVTKDSNGLRTKYGLNAQDHLPVKDVKDLTLDQARAVYKKEYWDKLTHGVKGFANLSQALQESAFDSAVNQGVGNATKWLGISGGNLEKFNQLRTTQYKQLAKDNPNKFAKFLEGWLSRLDGITPAIAAPWQQPIPRLSSTPLAPASNVNKNVTINQKTDVTIHGAKDPKETAKQVKRINDRTNGDLIRNFSPALR